MGGEPFSEFIPPPRSFMCLAIIVKFFSYSFGLVPLGAWAKSNYFG
jgi:hypothetical protein